MTAELQRIKAAGILTLNDAIILDDLQCGESTMNEIQARTRTGYSTVLSCLARLRDHDLVTRSRFRMGYVYQLNTNGKGIFKP